MSLRLFTLVCCLVAFTAGAEILPPRPATQTEANAGTDATHPITPKTMAGSPFGAGTNNGVTPAQLKLSQDSGTNNYKGTNINLTGSATAGGLVVTNGSTNLSLSASSLNVTDANKKDTSLANGGANTVVHGTTPPTYSAVVEADWSLTDVTTANVSTSKHGLVPKLPNDVTKFLDGTGAFSVPAGGGGGGSDTPWSAIHDANGHALTNLDPALNADTNAAITAANAMQLFLNNTIDLLNLTNTATTLFGVSTDGFPVRVTLSTGLTLTHSDKTNATLSATGGGGSSSSILMFGVGGFTVNSADIRWILPNAVQSGNLGATAPFPTDVVARTITNALISFSAANGNPLGAATNAYFSVWTNNVFAGYLATMQGNGSDMIMTNSGTASITLPANGSWAVGVSNGSASQQIGSFTANLTLHIQ